MSIFDTTSVKPKSFSPDETIASLNDAFSNDQGRTESEQEKVKTFGEVLSNIRNDQDEQIGFTFRDLCARPATTIPCLVDPLLPACGLAEIIGEEDSGKSLLMLQLLGAIAHGENSFLGLPINASTRKVLYVSTEDNPDAIAVRLKMQTRMIATENAGLLYGGEMEPDELKDKIEELLFSIQFALVVIDCFGDIFTQEGNDAGKVRQELRRWQGLASKYNTLIIIIHHIPKAKHGQAPDKTHALGSGSHSHKVRSQLTFCIRNDRHYLVATKNNYMSRKEKEMAWELEFDENRLTFSATGKRVPKSGLGSTKGTSRKEIDWEALFGSDIELQRKTINARLKENGIQSGDEAIGKAVESGLLINFKYGCYKLQLSNFPDSMEAGNLESSEE